jgi:hypothetical protein
MAKFVMWCDFLIAVMRVARRFRDREMNAAAIAANDSRAVDSMPSSWCRARRADDSDAPPQCIAARCRSLARRTPARRHRIGLTAIFSQISAGLSAVKGSAVRRVGSSGGRSVEARAGRVPHAEIARAAARAHIGDARAAHRVRRMMRDRSVGRSRVEPLENRAGGAGVRADV